MNIKETIVLPFKKDKLSRVRDVIKKTDSIINKARTKRTRKLDTMQRRAIKRIFNKPFSKYLRIGYRCRFNIVNSYHHKYFRETPSKTPFNSETKRVKRLEFTKAFVSKLLEFWKNVIFIPRKASLITLARIVRKLSGKREILLKFEINKYGGCHMI